MSGKAQNEHIASGFPARADIEPTSWIGRLVGDIDQDVVRAQAVQARCAAGSSEANATDKPQVADSFGPGKIGCPLFRSLVLA
jgi:hypothetical protein